MARTTLTLSDPVMAALRQYTAKTKNSMKAQSEVVEDALKEYFKARQIPLEE